MFKNYNIIVISSCLLCLFGMQLSTSMKDQTLKDVDDTLIEAGKFMEDVAREPSKVQCLERFAKCKEIVEWLKRVTKG